MAGSAARSWSAVAMVLLLGTVVPVACDSDDSTGPSSTSTSTTTVPATTTSTTPSSTPSTSTSTSTSSTTTTSTSSTTTTAVPVTTTTAPPTTTVPPTTVPPTTVPPTTAPPTTAPPTTVPPGAPSVPYDRLRTTERVVALTFDAGSDLGNTARILDLLGQEGVPATFGITGAFAEDHADAVRRMAREGHVVMNHSYSHDSFTGVSSSDVLLSTAERQEDLLRAEGILAPLIGRTTRPYWRPPYGDYDASVLADVGAIGYAATVMWTVDSLGWNGLTAAQITDRVLSRAVPGAIILMHVGSQSADADALPAVIDGLRSAGYSFVTIPAGLAG